ncbi:unnamed protein product [Cyclocybe aegerita]|uniref:LIM zinc-binding domain-containing protein n=1 Tax=Cyclocybe aegerita TaxID=1973307 RepID=A0A8S0X070_CYCAE|nr:unnamed protein product [Cyclocybe aegerita]
METTIPEMPAPAWGYAAGMVSEPHPKPAPQTAQQQPGSPEKGKGKLQKKIGPPKAPTPSVAPTQLNTQYPKASTFEQRQSYYQQPLGSLPALSQPTQLAHSRIPAGYAPQGRQQQAQEQEETEETEEDDEEEESDEGDEEEEGESDYPAQRQNRSHGGYGYEPEQRASPTKKILRPREKVDPYGGYMDVSPIGRKDGSGSPTKVNIRPKFRERVQRYQEELHDRKPKKVLREREPVELRSHERSRSAFEEREIVRHKREVASERERPRPGSAFARRRRYDDDDDDDDVRLAYEDEDDEESEEEEWRNMPKRGAATRRTRERVREWERDLDQCEGRESRSAASPQWGIRDLPSAAQRRALSTDPTTRYRDEYDEEEECRRGPSRERVYRDDQDPRLRYRGGSTGLPQLPAMTREGRGSPEKSQGGPRRKITPLKHHEDEDDQDTTPRRPTNQGHSLHMRFSAINLNGGPNGNRSDSRGSSSSGAWPADLPRLPRTPGSATTPGGVSNDAGGYFDVRPPQQGMSSQGSDFRHNQVHGTPNQRPNLNIDDPPPRATIVRTPSPGPSGYTFKRELPQQPRSRPQSQAYPQNTANEQLQRRRSLYSAPSEPIHQEVNASPQRRPQSQIYASSHGNSQPMFGHGQHQQPQQYCHNQSHPGSQPQLSFPDQGPQFSFDNRQQPQTPAPPALVGIESPHPIGGREKLADIPKLEEDSNDGSDHERTVPRINTPNSNVSRIHVDSGPSSIPMINIDSSPRMSNAMPMINVEPPRINVGSDTPRKQASQGANRPNVQVFEVPGVSVSGPEFDAHHSGPNINISGPDDHGGHHHGPRHEQHQHQPRRPPSQHSQFAGQQYGQQQRPGGLICGGCHGPIIGRIVSAMGSRWHPSCFKCAVCGELLEHVSSYEHDGRPYCHLDYHENFAPRCYSCKTAIIEEQFISLDDPALGKRTYHTQHFFCAECGDPFLDTSTQLATDSHGELALSGDGEFEGFTVYKGHPYCEACHVRLRLPKCKRCKKSIRDHEEAVEALGGKWCWSCFVCASCHKPFEDPSFFQRGDQPYCEHCFSIMLRNEV